jgi:hypothetical protein
MVSKLEDYKIVTEIILKMFFYEIIKFPCKLVKHKLAEKYDSPKTNRTFNFHPYPEILEL